MTDVVTYENRGGVAVLTIDKPPVNAMNDSLRRAILDALHQATTDADVTAIVVVGANDVFIAGADLKAFDGPRPGPTTIQVANALEQSGKPVVAAIDGFALGGGLEIALACHYRIAAARAVVGLPEVSIGLFPGGGGAQRLPRLIGLEKALEMISLGPRMPAPKAAASGIVDEVVDGDLLAAAVARARELASGDLPIRRTRDLPVLPEDMDERDRLIAAARETASRQLKGQVAPQHGIDAVEHGLGVSFDEALEWDWARFNEVLTGEQCVALRHVFFAEREVSKIPDVPRETPLRPIRTAAVIGAGTMGGGIAMCFANAGIPVTIVETAQDALDRGVARVRENYQQTVDRGRLSQDKMDRCMAAISTSLDMGGIADADIVVEAVFEEIDVKRQVFAAIDAAAKPGAILATNTSYLDVDKIASFTKRPEDVLGLHFFSPANVMKLLEVVRTEKTAKDVLATAMKLAKTLDKVGVVAGVCHGFVANRSRAVFVREAGFLVDEGALPQQVDKVLTDLGMPMGPFAVSDLAGLDISWAMRKAQAPLRPKDVRYSPTVDLICEMGRFGQKTGGGWYRYEAGSRKPIPDAVIEKLIVESSARQGIERRDISDDEIRARCVYAAVNEGAKILEEGKALRASDIDVMWIYGFGFPRYRGGIMHYADSVGLEKVYDRVAAFHETHGKLWTPANLLKDLAENDKSFADYDRT